MRRHRLSAGFRPGQGREAAHHAPGGVQSFPVFHRHRCRGSLCGYGLADRARRRVQHRPGQNRHQRQQRRRHQQHERRVLYLHRPQACQGQPAGRVQLRRRHTHGGRCLSDRRRQHGTQVDPEALSDVLLPRVGGPCRDIRRGTESEPPRIRPLLCQPPAVRDGRPLYAQRVFRRGPLRRPPPAEMVLERDRFIHGQDRPGRPEHQGPYRRAFGQAPHGCELARHRPPWTVSSREPQITRRRSSGSCRSGSYARCGG